MRFTGLSARAMIDDDRHKLANYHGRCPSPAPLLAQSSDAKFERTPATDTIMVTGLTVAQTRAALSFLRRQLLQVRIHGGRTEKPTMYDRKCGPATANLKIGPIARAILLFSTLILAKPLSARKSIDVIVMNNGDRLTCELKRLEAGVLYIGLDYVDGTVSIEWAKVARLESNQLFIIKTQTGSVYTGTLDTNTKMVSAQRAEIQVKESGRNLAAIDKSEIVDMRQTSEEFLKRFNGDISFGSSYSKGNDTGQYNFGFDMSYRRPRWAAETNLSSNLTSNSGADTSTRNALGISTYHLLRRDNYFYGGLANFLQSSVQGIRLQTSVGSGIGRFLKNTNRSKVSVMGGLAWQSTDYQQSGAVQPTQNVAAALIAMEVSFFKFSKTNLKITANAFPALSDPGRLRYGANASYFVKVFGDLSWTISFYGNWDNKPPPHFSGSDYGSTSGLGWSFGK